MANDKHEILTKIVREGLQVYGRDLSDTAATFWMDALKDHRIADVRKAFGKYCALERFPPAPSQILEHLPQLESQSQEQAIANHRCVVHSCPMSGSNSEGLKGGGPWYCFWHWPQRHNPVVCSQITEELLAKRKAPKWWADQLVEDRMRADHHAAA